MTPKAKLLLALDDPDTQQLLFQELGRSDVELQVVHSGSEAAEMINREKFDGIFLGWSISGRSGLELAERVRWSKSNSRCPMVMITEGEDPLAVRNCFKLGINFFLNKPVTAKQLQTLLNAIRGIMAMERRRYQRAPIETTIICEWSLQTLAQDARGMTINLSSTGALLKIDLSPAMGTVVKMKFILPGDPRPFKLSGRVVREASNQQVGVDFMDVPKQERQRLVELVERALSSDSEIAASSP